MNNRKLNEIVLTLKSRQIFSFDEILQIGKLNSYISDYEYADDIQLGEDVEVHMSDGSVKSGAGLTIALGNSPSNKRLFSEPKNTEDLPLLLYWEGQSQNISFDGFHEYFKEKGYRVVDDPAISCLLDFGNFFTEEKLKELELPENLSIVLPSAYENSFTISIGCRAFARIRRQPGLRELGMVINEEDYFGQKKHDSFGSGAAFIVSPL